MLTAECITFEEFNAQLDELIEELEELRSEARKRFSSD
jgi:hypothetical protein